jgi:hypothetical protein
MSDHRNELSDSEKDQIQANLELAALFIHELIQEPDRHDIIPDDATVVLLPPDDWGADQLTFANIEMAKHLMIRGENPILHAVGMPRVSGPQALVRWPIIGEVRLVIQYNRQQDVLTVAFTQVDRPIMPVRHHPYVIVLIDPETNLVVSYVIPNFLVEVAPRSLPLFDLLLLSSTELVGITREELRALRDELVRGSERPIRDRMSVAEILTELQALSA